MTTKDIKRFFDAGKSLDLSFPQILFCIIFSKYADIRAGKIKSQLR